MTTVSVVICAHLIERLPHVQQALLSLKTQTVPPDETIVVVDGEPALGPEIRALGLADKVLVRADRGGLSRARNTGIAAASGDLIAFLDDDATADPRWLEVFVRALESDPQALGVGGRSLPNWQREQPRWLPEEFLWVVGCTYHGIGDEPRVVRNVFGGCACVRRTAFEKVGGYSPHLGRTPGRQSGGEEAEFCLRAAGSMKGHFRYEPEAVIHHWVPVERSTVRYFLRRCLAEGESKAAVRSFAGSGSLGQESSYVRKTIPAAIGRAVLAAVTRHPGRAWTIGAIILGLGTTTLSYLRSRLRGGRTYVPHAGAPDISALRSDESVVELAAPGTEPQSEGEPADLTPRR